MTNIDAYAARVLIDSMSDIEVALAHASADLTPRNSGWIRVQEAIVKARGVRRILTQAAASTFAIEEVQ